MRNASAYQHLSASKKDTGKQVSRCLSQSTFQKGSKLNWKPAHFWKQYTMFKVSPTWDETLMSKTTHPALSMLAETRQKHPDTPFSDAYTRKLMTDFRQFWKSLTLGNNESLFILTLTRSGIFLLTYQLLDTGHIDI